METYATLSEADGFYFDKNRKFAGYYFDENLKCWFSSTFNRLEDAIMAAKKEACGCLGGVEHKYFKDKEGCYGFINHERGQAIELRDGLSEISPDYNKYVDQDFKGWYKAMVIARFGKIIAPELSHIGGITAELWGYANSRPRGIGNTSDLWGKFYTPLIKTVLGEEYDSSDGQGGTLSPATVAEQCVERYIRLLAEAVIFEGQLIHEVEMEVRERLFIRKQFEEDIRLFMSQPIKKAMADVVTIQPATNEIELF